MRLEEWDHAATLPLLGEAAGRIGAPDFYWRLMRAAGAPLEPDLAMVMRYSRHNAPEYLVYDQLEAAHMEHYLRGLYRVDPVYRLCREAEARGVYSLGAISTPEEKAGEYFSIFLQMTQMADDLVVLFPAPGGCCIGLVYERRTAFAAAEIAALRALYPLLAGLHSAHERVLLASLATGREAPAAPLLILDHRGERVFESDSWRALLAAAPQAAERLRDDPPAAGERRDLGQGLVVQAEALDDAFALAPQGRLLTLERGAGGLPPIDYEQALARFLAGTLTPRERDIVRLILLGFPTAKIAERLTLSINTIKNHKKRLYLKLDITTERELFLNFVLFLFHGE